MSEQITSFEQIQSEAHLQELIDATTNFVGFLKDAIVSELRGNIALLRGRPAYDVAIDGLKRSARDLVDLGAKSGKLSALDACPPTREGFGKSVSAFSRLITDNGVYPALGSKSLYVNDSYLQTGVSGSPCEISASRFVPTDSGDFDIFQPPSDYDYIPPYPVSKPVHISAPSVGAPSVPIPPPAVWFEPPAHPPSQNNHAVQSQPPDGFFPFPALGEIVGINYIAKNYYPLRIIFCDNYLRTTYTCGGGRGERARISYNYLYNFITAPFADSYRPELHLSALVASRFLPTDTLFTAVYLYRRAQEYDYNLVYGYSFRKCLSNSWQLKDICDDGLNCGQPREYYDSEGYFFKISYPELCHYSPLLSTYSSGVYINESPPYFSFESASRDNIAVVAKSRFSQSFPAVEFPNDGWHNNHYMTASGSSVFIRPTYGELWYVKTNRPKNKGFSRAWLFDTNKWLPKI